MKIKNQLFFLNLAFAFQAVYATTSYDPNDFLQAREYQKTVSNSITRVMAVMEEVPDQLVTMFEGQRQLSQACTSFFDKLYQESKQSSGPEFDAKMNSAINAINLHFRAVANSLRTEHLKIKAPAPEKLAEVKPAVEVSLKLAPSPVAPLVAASKPTLGTEIKPFEVAKDKIEKPVTLLPEVKTTKEPESKVSAIETVKALANQSRPAELAAGVNASKASDSNSDSGISSSVAERLNKLRNNAKVSEPVPAPLKPAEVAKPAEVKLESVKLSKLETKPADVDKKPVAMLSSEPASLKPAEVKPGAATLEVAKASTEEDDSSKPVTMADSMAERLKMMRNAIKVSNSAS